MKLFGKNISTKKLLLGVSALSIIGYLGVANFSTGPVKAPAEKRDQVDFPSKFNSNLDDLIARMQTDTAKYSQFIIIENRGHAVQVLLVGKNSGDTLWAPVDPVESAKETAWSAAGLLRCTDLTELGKACVQRKTMKDPVELKEEAEKNSFDWVNATINIAGWVIPMALVGGLIYWQIKRAGGLGSALGGRGKVTKAKLELVEPEDNKKPVTFADVKGMDATIDRLRMILTCLKNPELLSELGGMLQKGLLLVGPPGTGKTLLGRALAGEAGIPFFSIGGSDFQEMFVGVGSSRVDDMFEVIAEKIRSTGKPVILFIDEIDALLRTRVGSMGGNTEKDDTVGAFLKKMDGLVALGHCLIIGATNVPEQLDKAALRDGRFGDQIKVLPPNRKGLLDIINMMLGKVRKLSSDIDPEVLASEFFDNSFTGADCMGVILQRAPILALIRCDQTGAEPMLTMADCMLALEKKVLGDIDLTEEVPEDFETLVGKHELGHLVCVLALHDMSTKLGNIWSKPVKSITIRGPKGTGGMVRVQGQGDLGVQSRKELRGMLVVAQGGTASEEFFFDDWSIGDQGDEKQAERVADHMVTRFRMSPNRMLPPISIDEPGQSNYLGAGQGMKPTQYGLGADSANQIDIAKGILTRDGHAKARALVRLYSGFIDYLFPFIIEKKMMKADEVEKHWADWKKSNQIEQPEWLTNPELWNAFWDDRAEPPTVADLVKYQEATAKSSHAAVASFDGK